MLVLLSGLLVLLVIGMLWLLDCNLGDGRCQAFCDLRAQRRQVESSASQQGITEAVLRDSAARGRPAVFGGFPNLDGHVSRVCLESNCDVFQS